MKHSMVGWVLDQKEPENLSEALKNGLDQCMIGYRQEEVETIILHLNYFLEKKKKELYLPTFIEKIRRDLAKRKKLLNR